MFICTITKSITMHSFMHNDNCGIGYGNGTLYLELNQIKNMLQQRLSTRADRNCSSLTDRTNHSCKLQLDGGLTCVEGNG
ncbi:unnamed protein product [Linum trigynum]|uniref:Uncharacterized protein n=1 Tax=Linum trigynum TaxID=586398 RepID=A0AAV2C958_9ROSI